MADCRYLTEYAPLAHHRREMAVLNRRQRRRLGLGLLAVVACTTGGYLIMPPLGIMLAGIGAMALFFAAITGGSSVPAHVLSGVEGEVRTLKALKSLPDDHVLFNQVMVPDPRLPNGERELDFIVVGPNGINVIEVKNTPGIIYVDPDKKHWQTARRAGCGSRPGWNALDNPLYQVKAQADALDRWLLSNGLSASVQSMVCFANPGVIIENANHSRIPVIVPELIKKSLADTQGNTTLKDSSRKKLIRLLSGSEVPGQKAA
jgi:hypothetical protein